MVKVLPLPNSLSTPSAPPASAMILRRDGEAEADAALAGARQVALLELAEYALKLGGIHAGSAIADLHDQRPVGPIDGDQHAARLGEFHGVADDIVENLAEAGGIEFQYLRHIRRYGGGDLDALRMGAAREHFDDTFDQRPDGLQPRAQMETAGGERREIQQVFHQLHKRGAGLADAFEIVVLLGV